MTTQMWLQAGGWHGAGQYMQAGGAPPGDEGGLVQGEISRLAQTMNAMLARIEAGHAAQRRFVGDASHELRSPWPP